MGMKYEFPKMIEVIPEQEQDKLSPCHQSARLSDAAIEKGR